MIKNYNYKGTFVSGIWDVEQMQNMQDVQAYYRVIDSAPIRDFTMTGMKDLVCLGE